MDVATLTTMLCLAGFAGLSLAAAVTDVQSRRIPNSFVIVIALLFGVHFLANFGQIDWVGPLVMAGVILCVGIVLFSFNLLGAGDVKMLAAAGLWAGFSYAPHLLAVTGLVGGLLGLGYVLSDYIRRIPWVPLPPRPAIDENGEKTKVYLPYGVAICAGALVVAVQMARDIALAAGG